MPGYKKKISYFLRSDHKRRYKKCFYPHVSDAYYYTNAENIKKKKNEKIQEIQTRPLSMDVNEPREIHTSARALWSGDYTARTHLKRKSFLPVYLGLVSVRIKYIIHRTRTQWKPFSSTRTRVYDQRGESTYK